MSLYEIDIHRNDPFEPVNMEDVYRALEMAGIEIDKDERRNTLYGGVSDEQPEYVYIADGKVDQAVKIINGLGYSTDEDENEE